MRCTECGQPPADPKARCGHWAVCDGCGKDEDCPWLGDSRECPEIAKWIATRPGGAPGGGKSRRRADPSAE